MKLKDTTSCIATSILLVLSQILYRQVGESHGSPCAQILILLSCVCLFMAIPIIIDESGGCSTKSCMFGGIVGASAASALCLMFSDSLLAISLSIGIGFAYGCLVNPIMLFVQMSFSAFREWPGDGP